jgi:hypothetical protein
MTTVRRTVMKRKILTISLVLATLLALLMAGSPAGAQPTGATKEEIEEAITKGVEWLASQQNDDGSWGYGCDRVAHTGLAVLKFETKAIEHKPDPLDPMGADYEYSDQVVNGLSYIFANSHEQDISSQPEADGNGNGKGVYFADCGHEIYNTGIAMMAIASSGHPELYGSDLQDAVDYMAWAQADPGCSLHRGGWRYSGNVCDSDNSNAGYVTLGLGYAEAAPPYGFGLTIPQFVKDELSIWIDAIQDDVNGDSDDGGSWYTPYSTWVNILKTGNLIFEMRFVGEEPSAQRFQDALDYIERHWQDTDTDPGWGFGQDPANYQAMFTVMKGFEYSLVDLIDLDGDDTPEHDWFDEFSTVLVEQQEDDGSWPGWCQWGNDILCTSWALLTLEKATPPSLMPVDIKPGSCPNPLNIKSKGVLPIAILGTETFDVTRIAPDSVLLEGVAPLRWSIEDVATPSEPVVGKQDCLDCTDEGPDGFPDLTLKFDTQEVVDVIDPVADRECRVLQLTGDLKAEYGGTTFMGEDVVTILKKK